MPIDHSIYFRQKGVPDLADAVSEGMTLGRMIKKNRLEDQERKNKRNMKDILREAVTIGPDGKRIVNQDKVIQGYNSYDPAMAVEYQNNLDKQAKVNQLAAEKLKLENSRYANERQWKREQAAQEQKNKDRQFDLDQKKFNHTVTTKKTPKQTPAQIKQGGLYEIGRKAEEQYQAAVNPKNKGFTYDPTSKFQYFDNDPHSDSMFKNKYAKAAHAAQDSWIESFLRDASGAAIPDSERDSYRRIFFPAPGDTDQVVKNKKQLREQKMQNALLASGKQQSQPRTIIKRQVNQRTGDVRVVYSDGTTEVVSQKVAGQ